MIDTQGDSPINSALRQFEATEANLAKLERLWSEMEKLTPEGLAFGNDLPMKSACEHMKMCSARYRKSTAGNQQASRWTLTLLAKAGSTLKRSARSARKLMSKTK